MVEIRIEYEGDLHCRLEHGPSRATIATDAPADNQGKGEAFSPTDLLAASLGSCMMTTMGIHARREAIELRGSRVKVRKEMVADPLRRVGRLIVEITLPESIEAERRPILENVALTCPVQKSLHPNVQVDVTFRYGLDR